MFLGSDIYCVSLQVQECCYWPDAEWPSLQGSCSALTFIYPSSSAARGLPLTDYPSRCVAMFLALSVPQECFYASDTTQECYFWHWLPPPPPQCCYNSDTIPQGVLLQFWQCLSPRSIAMVLTLLWVLLQFLHSIPPPPPPQCCYGSNTVYPLPWVLLQF